MYFFSLRVYLALVTAVPFQISLQFCPEEVSRSGIPVTWYQSLQANFVRSDPLCIHDAIVITRNCTNNTWLPPLEEVLPCHTAVKYFDTSSCPPGFKTISDRNNSYCYQIGKPSPWGNPCTQTGGATVITELNLNDTLSLLNCLNKTKYNYFWLPAQRRKIFGPIVWSTPGPMWGHLIESNDSGILPLNPSFLKNCLLLDVQQRQLLTEKCNKVYPSLCFYMNDFHSPAKCPNNYHAFRYTSMLDEGRCFGIEKTKNKLTLQEFLNEKCKNPMGDGPHEELRRYVYSKIANIKELPNDMWCWFSTYVNSFPTYNSGLRTYANESTSELPPLAKVINSNGLIAFMDSYSKLPCIASETDMVNVETELALEYDEDKNEIYLTVYFPSGLWMYNNKDRGVQCFSDADGFFRVIKINDLSNPPEILNVEKIIYVINLVTDRSARYWCEGHTKNFALITTDKIVVNPQGSQVHVFSLVLKLNFNLTETNTDFMVNDLTTKISSIFKAKKVLLMDILEYTLSSIEVLIHLHVAVNDTYKDESQNLQATFNILNSKAEIEFPKYNYTIVNISSSVYCLPTVSYDSIVLNWDLTPVGHITAPRQFCLQANGLPVNRQCHGSYLLGSVWGEVEGKCDFNYQPTNATTFLFNFIKGYAETNCVCRFLTAGLEFILKDVSILIPADIYYISLSFNLILHIAKQNRSLIETGDIDNIAWIMDRIMNINNHNLRLAQTLNSTNAILDSTNNIIELITINDVTKTENETIKNIYKLAVQPRFVVQVSYPNLNNITGIIIESNGDSDNFTDMIVKPLYKNMTVTEILSIENLEIATWLPNYVVNSLQKTNNDTDDSSTLATSTLKVVINVYNDNSIFQELSRNKHIVNSRIVEVAIPGYKTNLEYPIPLIFRNLKDIGQSKVCGYWDFQTEQGFWSKRGCILKFTKGNLTVCNCYHLTHFAQLINSNRMHFGESTCHSEKHDKALNIITLVGSFLSLLGITGIWITATVFDTWRKKTGTKVLLHLTLSIAMPLILLIVFDLDDSIIRKKQGKYLVQSDMVAICVSLGALFHYSVLANFVWMLITAVLQFIRYVRVLGVRRPSRFMIKMTLVGWGVPFIPVLIILIVDYTTYIPNPLSNRSFCYPSGLYMILGVVVPICLILIINVILFLLVIKSISKSTNVRTTDRNLIWAQFRLSVFLFFLLGLTWIFGVASFSGKLVWSYLFCLTSTIQGFVLFIYFVICDPNTRNMWASVMKPQFARSRTSVTTISCG